jgi:hypothetical protein
VLDQLGEGVGLPQQPIDEGGGVVWAGVPQPRQPGAQLADGVQLGLVVGALAGPPPGRGEAVEGRGVGQLLGAAAAGVDQGGSGGQGHLGVMSKNHFYSLHTDG